MTSQRARVEYAGRLWEVKIVGLREMLMLQGSPYYWRLRGSQSADDWKPYEQETGPEQLTEKLLQLSLVRLRQGQNQPHHWLLFVHRENEAGDVFQVTGDALNMRYDHANNIDIMRLENFHDSFLLKSDLSATHLQTIKDFVVHEPPPRAENQRDVKENCQGWTIRVMRDLVDSGMIGEKWIESAKDMMDPLDRGFGT